MAGDRVVLARAVGELEGDGDGGAAIRSGDEKAQRDVASGGNLDPYVARRSAFQPDRVRVVVRRQSVNPDDAAGRQSLNLASLG